MDTHPIDSNHYNDRVYHTVRAYPTVCAYPTDSVGNCNAIQCTIVSDSMLEFMSRSMNYHEAIILSSCSRFIRFRVLAALKSQFMIDFASFSFATTLDGVYGKLFDDWTRQPGVGSRINRSTPPLCQFVGLLVGPMQEINLARQSEETFGRIIMASLGSRS